MPLVRSGVVDRLLRNLQPAASQLFLTTRAHLNFYIMDEESEDKKNAGSHDFKALPNDIAQVSIKEYFEDRDNNFKVVDVRTREEYYEDRWEVLYHPTWCFLLLLCVDRLYFKTQMAEKYRAIMMGGRWH